ncbi:hypothetical protein QJS10_CPB12g00758 [Acorus calamus]|uniref:Uncharacterized protein n=1 Tax=Acorus calamus TaxID=4465 RepID=A0AAV9DLE4_ACOCL|nr:hypothetical protein QJS10_CPB12g00758 [Acorus calamus]
MKNKGMVIHLMDSDQPDRELCEGKQTRSGQLCAKYPKKYAKVEDESKILKQAVVASKTSPPSTSPPMKSARESRPKEQWGEKTRRPGNLTNEEREGQGMNFKIPPSQILSKI